VIELVIDTCLLRSEREPLSKLEKLDKRDMGGVCCMDEEREEGGVGRP
jgi:hypothetical protein